jgi:hypothetical protein
MECVAYYGGYICDESEKGNLTYRDTLMWRTRHGCPAAYQKSTVTEATRPMKNKTNDVLYQPAR